MVNTVQCPVHTMVWRCVLQESVCTGLRTMFVRGTVHLHMGAHMAVHSVMQASIGIPSFPMDVHSVVHGSFRIPFHPSAQHSVNQAPIPERVRTVLLTVGIMTHAYHCAMIVGTSTVHALVHTSVHDLLSRCGW